MINKKLEERISKLETRLKNFERSILESDNNIKKLEKLTSDIRVQEIWEKFQKEREYFKKKSY